MRLSKVDVGIFFIFPKIFELVVRTRDELAIRVEDQAAALATDRAAEVARAVHGERLGHGHHVVDDGVALALSDDDFVEALDVRKDVVDVIDDREHVIHGSTISDSEVKVNRLSAAPAI